MLTLHLEAGKYIQMAEIPFWTKMVQYQFRQYHFSALRWFPVAQLLPGKKSEVVAMRINRHMTSGLLSPWSCLFELLVAGAPF